MMTICLIFPIEVAPAATEGAQMPATKKNAAKARTNKATRIIFPYFSFAETGGTIPRGQHRSEFIAYPGLTPRSPARLAPRPANARQRSNPRLSDQADSDKYKGRSHARKGNQADDGGRAGLRVRLGQNV